MRTRSAQSAVFVRDVVVSFSRWGQKVTAVDKISFDVLSGEWVLLVGHNGAGKSTVLKTLGGQLRPDAGEVLINGTSVQTLKPAQLAMTVFTVHQDPLLGSAPLLTVFENIFVADPKSRSASRSDLMTHYISLLEPIGLAGRIKQPVKVLSGGERQLLALLIARLRQTPVILLDEPLAALDPSKTDLCVAEISAMHREGKTIIQVAHDIRALTARADRIITLQEGQVATDAQLATPKGIVDRDNAGHPEIAVNAQPRTCGSPH
jgi:putative ABC transport system ATP-binding protein